MAGPGLNGRDGLLEDCEIAGVPLLRQATRPDLWLDWFQEAGLDPVTILRGARFEQFGMVIAAARANLGIALVPDLLVQGEIADGSLVVASRRTLRSASGYCLVTPA